MAKHQTGWNEFDHCARAAEGDGLRAAGRVVRNRESGGARVAALRSECHADCTTCARGY